MSGVAKSKFGSPLLSGCPKQAGEEEHMLFPVFLSFPATKQHWYNVIYTHQLKKWSQLVASMQGWPEIKNAPHFFGFIPCSWDGQNDICEINIHYIGDAFYTLLDVLVTLAV